jgi:hypothetical protein
MGLFGHRKEKQLEVNQAPHEDLRPPPTPANWGNPNHSNNDSFQSTSNSNVSTADTRVNPQPPPGRKTVTTTTTTTTTSMYLQRRSLSDSLADFAFLSYNNRGCRWHDRHSISSLQSLDRSTSSNIRNSSRERYECCVAGCKPADGQYHNSPTTISTTCPDTAACC